MPQILQSEFINSARFSTDLDRINNDYPVIAFYRTDDIKPCNSFQQIHVRIHTFLPESLNNMNPYSVVGAERTADPEHQGLHAILYRIKSPDIIFYLPRQWGLLD